MLDLHPPLYHIQDKSFALLVSHEAIMARNRALATQLNAQFANKNPILVPVLTGALLFLGDLLPLLTFTYQLAPIKVSSYGSGMHSTGQPHVPDLHIAPQGRHIIVIEDIVDSGNTIAALHDKLMGQGAASFFVAAALFKPHAFTGTVRPDWAGFEIGDAFVIGYGLDWAEHGRHLRGIYQLQN